jgi:hypothetical protein
VLKPAEKASFSASGTDQYGQPVKLTSVTWHSTGGSIDSAGLYVAEGSPGQYTVKVESNGLEGIAEVRIVSASTPNPDNGGGKKKDDDHERQRVIRWKGTVPPQKWMNFYTKVLSRFASMPGLSIRVTLEVPADGEQAKAKIDEAKSGIKELGLDGEVHFGD